MIVVGIIGILVSLAGTNFRRYQARARQSEAKLNLAAIYGLQKSFYSEYSAYIGAFPAIGFTPEGNRAFYGYGVAQNTPAGVGAAVTGFTSVTGLENYGRLNAPAGWTTCAVTNHTGTTYQQAGIATGLGTAGFSYPDSQVFTEYASGQILDATGCDIWQITHLKVLTNTTVGY